MPELAPRDRRPQRVALLPGDGIGPEVVGAAEAVLRAAIRRYDLPLELKTLAWGAEHYLTTGETLPEGALERLRGEFSAILAGAFGDPRVPSNVHARDILLGLRFGLDLYVGFRPVRLLDPRLCPLRGRSPAEVEMVVFRESTEGAYVGMGGTFKRGTPEELAVDEAIHTRRGVERILVAAFEHAAATPGRRLCLAHKANALEHGHGLWRRCFDELAER
ncbi:MAG: 3-isopropylmalate dehydrogenase, partial [Acidobacteria bacterium]|nr:3-isopropylmalate dehydrogenase [Acidobacteriota bacterium]